MTQPVQEVPTLETSRLTLRLVTVDDAPRLQELFADFEVVQYLSDAVSWPSPSDGSLQHVLSVLPKNASGEQYDWSIVLKADGNDQPTGKISLYPHSDNDHRGFWLGRKYWRNGYMTEAAAAVTDFAFNSHNLPFLLVNNAEPNVGSHRLKEKSGARIVEIRDDVGFVGGRFREERWNLTRDDWEKHR